MNKKLLLSTFLLVFVLLTGCSVSDIKQLTEGNVEINEEYVFDSKNVKNVNAKVFIGDLEILPTDEEQIKVTVKATVPQFFEKYSDFEAKIEDDILVVDLSISKTIDLNPDDKEKGINYPDVKVYLPKKQYYQMNAETIVGTIYTENIPVEHSFFKSTIGNVVVKNYKSNVSIDILKEGNLHGENITGKLKASTVNGELNLDSVSRQTLNSTK